MVTKSVGALSVVVMALLLSLSSWAASTARDRTGDGPKLVRTQRLGRPVPTTIRGERSAALTSVAWSPDGQRVAAAGGPGYAVRLWNASTGKEQHFWDDHSVSVGGVAWSPAGKLLATAGVDNVVKLWDSATGRLKRTLEHVNPNSGDYLSSLHWSPDGSRLAASGDDPGVYVWNAATGREEAHLELGGPLLIDWSPDGRELAVANVSAYSPDWKRRVDAPIRILDTTTWKEKRVFYDQEHVSVAWSPNGKRLASTNFAGEIRVEDSYTGRLLWELSPLIFHPRRVRGPDGSVATAIDVPDLTDGSLQLVPTRCIAWNPARALLATGGFQGVQICDAANGRHELLLGEHMGWVNAVAWSPDGRRLASCGDEGVARVWDLAFPRK